MRARLTRAAIVFLALLVLTPAEAGTGSTTRDCGGGHTLTMSPTLLWPPNHKLNTVTITYREADPESTHELTVQVTNVTVLDSLKGDGNTTYDFAYPQQPGTGTGSVSVPLLLRAERAGTGDGRIYQISYTAVARTTPEAAPHNDCSGNENPASKGVLTVIVPHDCRQGSCRSVS